MHARRMLGSATMLTGHLSSLLSAVSQHYNRWSVHSDEESQELHEVSLLYFFCFSVSCLFTTAYHASIVTLKKKVYTYTFIKWHFLY